MISSKTHEIIVIPGFKYSEDFLLAQQNLKELKDIELFDEIKFVQKIGDFWQLKMNYSWLICCGYIPFQSFIRKECLPSIDKYNADQFIFDTTIYQCPNSVVGYLFDSRDDRICPTCNEEHFKGNIHHPEDMWADYPHYTSFHQIIEEGGIDAVLDKITKTDYKFRRIYANHEVRKGIIRRISEKMLWRNSEKSDERKYIHGGLPINKKG